MEIIVAEIVTFAVKRRTRKMRLIDADELLTDNTWTWFDEYGNYTAVGEIINDAPTIDTEPVKHGEWINRRITKKDVRHLETYGELVGYHDICSVCGFDIHEFWYATGKPQYCPKCGADMRGDKE